MNCVKHSYDNADRRKLDDQMQELNFSPSW